MDDQKIAALLNENAELRKKLEEFEALKEDLLSKRVFEKSRTYLFSWITLGGVLLTVSGLFGIKATKDYVAQLVTKKLETVTQEQLQRNIETESKRQIEIIVTKQTATLDSYAKRKIEQIILASKPIKSLTTPAEVESFGPQLDYSGDIKFVRDSGPEGSVVGLSVATTLEYQISKVSGKAQQISARHIYYLAQVAGGLDPRKDSGAYIKDAISALSTEGAVEEQVWPYRAGEQVRKPPTDVEKASKFKITQATRLTGLQDIKKALKEIGPIVAGISFYDTWWTEEAAKTGIIKLPSEHDQIYGLHAVCIVGYDDNKKLIKFVNSWGSKWGEKGFGYFPYEYLEKYLIDAWSFRFAGM